MEHIRLFGLYLPNTYRNKHQTPHRAHPTFTNSREDLVSAHIDSGAPEAAAPLYKHLLPIVERKSGEDSADVVGLLLEAAEAHVRGGLPEVAAPLQERGLRILERGDDKYTFCTSVSDAVLGLAEAHAVLKVDQSHRRLLQGAALPAWTRPARA